MLNVQPLTCSRTFEKLPGSFEEELTIRGLAEALRRRVIDTTQEMAERFKKPEETDLLPGIEGMSFEDSTLVQQRKSANSGLDFGRRSNSLGSIIEIIE